jgi:hypothetical protein
MKKTLAAIVEYKLNRNNLNTIPQRILTELNNKTIKYPHIFEKEMRELLGELRDIPTGNNLSESDEARIIDVLKEMELILVDYLTNISYQQTNDCFYH